MYKSKCNIHIWFYPKTNIFSDVQTQKAQEAGRKICCIACKKGSIRPWSIGLVWSYTYYTYVHVKYYTCIACRKKCFLKFMPVALATSLLHMYASNKKTANKRIVMKFRLTLSSSETIQILASYWQLKTKI